MKDSSRPGQPNVPMNRLQRRRAKIAAEIARNRRGEYKIPTWVLAVLLVLVVLGWIALIVLPSS